MVLSRRNFIKMIGLSATVFAPLRNARASTEKIRSLSLHNIHTDERLKITYARAGRYDYEAIEEINHLLRCHYTNEVKPIDINVLDLLCDIKDRIGTDGQIDIISGYRSPAYNDHLKSLGRRVAKNSLHLRGLAIDFSISGYNNHTVSRVAKSFVSGGVGAYPDFVHIDTGPVRFW